VYAVIAAAAACIVSGGVAGCANESPAAAREKLTVILEDDLQTVIEELPPESLIDSPRYVIESYKSFDQGKYRHLAVVNFYFVKSVDVRMVRKYRYHRDFRKWERYFNEYRFLYDSTDTAGL
jgi:hypothetical protein